MFCPNTSYCCLSAERLHFTRYFTYRSGSVAHITICWAVKNNRMSSSQIKNTVIDEIVAVGDNKSLLTEDLLHYLAYENSNPIELENI